MKPRRVMVSIETETGVPINRLKKVSHVTLYSGGLVIGDLGVGQIQVSVIRRPKAGKKR